MKASIGAFALTFLLQAANPSVLKIVEAGIHQSEDGALVRPGTAFVPGETIFFSCLLDGYRVSPSKKVAIQYEFSAVDPVGVALVEPVAGKVDTELAPQDNEWKPKIRQTVLVPPLAEPGTYKIRLSAKDTLGEVVATVEMPFEVSGHAVERSETLVVRNFRFYRGEEDAEPLKISAYRPGDAVWARFDITGYKIGPGNMRDVAYTVTVKGPGGKILLAPGEPSVDKGSSFYPVRYVPCTISLNLQPDIRPEEYTIMVQARDRIGNREYELKQTFRVE